MRKFALIFALLLTVPVWGWEREPLWPKGKMPDAQPGLTAVMTDEAKAPGYNPDNYRMPYLEWYDAPSPAIDKDVCMILISGGGYNNTCDYKLIKLWRETFTALGVQCVSLVYRTPRPEGLPIYQCGWEDGQRAVRMVRSEAARRGFDPEKIGVIGMSAGSHLGLLLATSSETPAYQWVDMIDNYDCHINWAILNAPAYVMSDGETNRNAREGYGADVTLSSVFKFDSHTCPMSLHHGGMDPYSPNGSTQVYRVLRRLGIPAELHL